jgi:hypothetical protein
LGHLIAEVALAGTLIIQKTSSRFARQGPLSFQAAGKRDGVEVHAVIKPGVLLSMIAK